MLLDGAKNRYDDPPPSFNAAMGITSRSNSLSAHSSSPPPPHPTYNSNYRTYNPVHDPFNTAEELGSHPTIKHPAVIQGNQGGPQWLSPPGTSSGGSFIHSEASSSNVILPQRTTRDLDSQHHLPMQAPMQAPIQAPSQMPPSSTVQVMEEKDASQPSAQAQRGGWALIWLGCLLFCTSPLYVAGFVLIAAGKIIEGCGLILTSMGNWTKCPHEKVLASFQMVEGGGQSPTAPNPQMDERRNTVHMA